jgi:hypothetical protein
LGAGRVAEEEGGFGVLDGLGGFFVEGAFAARIAGFSILELDWHFLIVLGSLHLSQHLVSVLLVELKNYSWQQQLFGGENPNR